MMAHKNKAGLIFNYIVKAQITIASFSRYIEYCPLSTGSLWLQLRSFNIGSENILADLISNFESMMP